MLKRDQPLAIYMEGELGGEFGKMGLGVFRYSPNPIACIVDSTRASGEYRDAVVDRRAPIVARVADARRAGAEVLVLGIAPPGGLIPPSWLPAIDEAWEGGMSLVNGLHDLLAPRYGAGRPGQWVWDVRVEPEGLAPGTGAAAALPNKRVLMIGTDMAIGKMTAGLELVRAARTAGVDAAFVATGQIGIVVTGRGTPLDAVRVDFASGAIEAAVLAEREAALIVVEGQGSLGHPGSTANLPLLRGAMPTHLVLCHRAGQTSLRRLPHVPIPPLGDFSRLYEDLASACGVFPRPRTVGVCLNTAELSPAAGTAACAELEAELGLPTVDPIRHGCARLIAALV